MRLAEGPGACWVHNAGEQLLSCFTLSSKWAILVPCPAQPIGADSGGLLSSVSHAGYMAECTERSMGSRVNSTGSILYICT